MYNRYIKRTPDWDCEEPGRDCHEQIHGQKEEQACALIEKSKPKSVFGLFEKLDLGNFLKSELFIFLLVFFLIKEDDDDEMVLLIAVLLFLNMN